MKSIPVVASLLIAVALSGCVGQPLNETVESLTGGNESNEDPDEPEPGDGDGPAEDRSREGEERDDEASDGNATGRVDLVTKTTVSRTNESVEIRYGVGNRGPDAAGNVTLDGRIPRPNGSVETSGPAAEDCTQQGTNVTCGWSELSANGTTYLVINASYDRCRSVTSSVRVDASAEIDETDNRDEARVGPADGCPEDDRTEEGDSDSRNDTRRDRDRGNESQDDGSDGNESDSEEPEGNETEGPNVGVDKTADRSDRNVTFDIEVRSDGSDDATNVTLRDRIPEPNGSANVSQGNESCTLDDRNLTCHWSKIPPDQQRTVVVEAPYDRCRTPTNRANVTADEDADASDDSDSARVPAAEGCDGGNGTDGNGTEGNETGNASRTWPAKDEASIRPGVLLDADGTRCTVGFIVSDADNTTLYATTASHCVGGMSIGDPVSLGGIEDAATIAYCSWGTIEGTNGSCPDEDEAPSDEEDNDLAILRIDDDHRDEVHPAVLRWGGPTAVADVPVPFGTHVLTYGASSFRFSTLDGREGYVTTSDEETTTAYFATSSVLGDSGSPVITSDGTAVGHISTVVLAPQAGANGIVNLQPTLAFAADATGVDYELKIWEVVDDGTLPG